MNDTTKRWLWILAGIVIIVAVALLVWKLDKDYGIFGGRFGGSGIADEGCFPLEGYGFSEGDEGQYIPPDNLVCIDGGWVNQSEQPGARDVYCEAYFRLIEIDYTKDGPMVTRTEAQGNEFCWDGEIIPSPWSCGDYRCGQGEDEINCWVDCGIIQSWERMRETNDDPELQTYLESEYEFDYDNAPEVEALAKEVEATSPESPFFAIKTLTRILNQRMAYVRGGEEGNRQCGEGANLILERNTGNCVDFSVVMITVLRRGFDIPELGRVRIPARQESGCLSGVGSRWGAVEYSVVDDITPLKGEILGHSWASAYVGHEHWLPMDPTTNTALIKTWWGYYPIEHSESQSLCWIPEDYRLLCETWADTG